MRQAGKNHGNRVGFLTGRTSRRPYRQAPFGQIRPRQARQNRFAERIEIRRIAKEGGIANRHCFHHRLCERLISMAEFIDNITDAGKAVMIGNRLESSENKLTARPRQR
jgi:hypothetical protein